MLAATARVTNVLSTTISEPRDPPPRMRGGVRGGVVPLTNLSPNPLSACGEGAVLTTALGTDSRLFANRQKLLLIGSIRRGDLVPLAQNAHVMAQVAHHYVGQRTH